MRIIEDRRAFRYVDIFPTAGQCNAHIIHAGQKSDFHKHPFEEWWLVINGKLEISYDEMESDKKPDFLSGKNPQILHIDKDTWHAYKTHTECLVIIYMAEKLDLDKLETKSNILGFLDDYTRPR